MYIKNKKGVTCKSAMVQKNYFPSFDQSISIHKLFTAVIDNNNPKPTRAKTLSSGLKQTKIRNKR